MRVPVSPFLFSWFLLAAGRMPAFPKRLKPKPELRNSITPKLCNSHLPFHPYLPFLTDRHSLSSEGRRKWTAGGSEQ